MNNTKTFPSDRILQVYTLGHFSVKWMDQMIIGGAECRETQFVYLLQIMLHKGTKGIPYIELEQILLESREVNDRKHAIQSILYNARKKLRKYGIPGDPYIYQKNGIFFWTDELQLIEDAAIFEQLFQKAENNACSFLDVCYAYTGEFLGGQSIHTWVSRECFHYRQMFSKALRKGAAELEQKHDFAGLEKLGNYASRVDPYHNWETFTINALRYRGKIDDSLALQREVSSACQKEGFIFAPLQ